MSKLIIIERNENVATSDELLTKVADVIDDTVTDDVDLNTEVLGSEEDISSGEGYSEEVVSDEGFVDDSIDYVGEDMIMDPGFDDGMYMDPGMEMGMGEVKDPLLSSWPSVIGISAVVLAVSIVVGVLLAKLRIKKGIDLYED